MLTLFFSVCAAIILAEIIKGLSANGTPPVLQSFSWQMDLAYFMWSHIVKFRIVLLVILAGIAIQLDIEHPAMFATGIMIWLALWGGIYWLFNKFWIGKYKFLPITQKIFANAKDNVLDLNLPVIGVDINGEQKAYPANLLFYHHQLSDVVGGRPILATYCGMCRSGRVYDIDWQEGIPEFQLVGAISYNAVLRDSLTNSWWRQETGEAAKGARQGSQLEDVYFEQMSLKNWLAKHPESLVLQYDPAFEQKYHFFAKLLHYEASLPGWHLQQTPPMVVGIEIDGQAKAYDLLELQKNRLIQDNLAGKSILVISDEDGQSAFIYSCNLASRSLNFTLNDGIITDQETGSVWNHLGECIEGQHLGEKLQQLQSYQQFVRAWIIFHPQTAFYHFNAT